MRLRALLPLSVLTLYPFATFATVPFSKTVIDSVFTGTAQPADLRVADMDGDTDLDLVVVSVDYSGSNEAVLLYTNDGAENFTRSTIDATVADPYALAVDDIDGDVDMDIVVGNGGTLYLYLNTGGTFTRQTVDASLANVRRIRFGRLDADGDMDLAVLTNNGVFWEENDGSENFTQHTIDGTPVTDNALALVDIDLDSDLDIVSSVYDVGTDDSWCSRYTNNGSAVFTRYTFDVHHVGISDLITDHIDADALPDVVTCEFESNRVMWYAGSGMPGIAAVGINYNQAPQRTWVSDIDNDTDKDVVVVGGNGAVGEVVYFENDGCFTFAKRTVDATAGNRLGLAVVDIDGNGNDDIFVLNTFPDQVVMYRAPSVGAGVAGPPDASARLGQNYPNPFNPGTTVVYELARSAVVRLEIVTATGERVRVLMDRRIAAGSHTAYWDGRDERGVVVGSGVYFCRLSVEGRTIARKMVALK